MNSGNMAESGGMRLVLTYSGLLPPNGNRQDKHRIRSALLPQLRQQWDIEPVLRQLKEPDPKSGRAPINDISAAFTKGGFNFVPLVMRQYDLVCYLEITLLRTEAPGAVIQSGGDIDNRIKTLFDSLSIPPNENQISGLQPEPEENPFYTLLEDDSLVTGFQIKTERLLEQQANANDVRVTIIATVRPTKVTVGNLGFLGGWL